VCGVEVKPPGTNRFNILSRNDYSTLVPGYLLLHLEYSTLHRIVPKPNKVLRDPVENEKYALYIAFEGKVPTQSSVTGAGSDYYEEDSDTEEVNATIGYYDDNSRRGKRSRSGTISEDARKSIRNTEE
jgi:5-methylcytosine-specific restriction endonuclease McrA